MNDERSLLDRDLPREVRRAGIVVIVKAARSDGHEIPCLSALAGRQETDLVDLRAIRVLRMWIRRHVVRARVVIDEQHARTRADFDIARAGTRIRDRDRIRLNRRSRIGRRRPFAGNAGNRQDNESRPREMTSHEIILLRAFGTFRRERGLGGGVQAIDPASQTTMAQSDRRSPNHLERGTTSPPPECAQ